MTGSLLYKRNLQCYTCTACQNNTESATPVLGYIVLDFGGIDSVDVLIHIQIYSAAQLT